MKTQMDIDLGISRGLAKPKHEIEGSSQFPKIRLTAITTGVLVDTWLKALHLYSQMSWM